MEPDLTQERKQAHALLDLLPNEKVGAVRSLLQVMVEPLSRSLASAPEDEEEIAPSTAHRPGARSRFASSRRKHSARTCPPGVWAE